VDMRKILLISDPEADYGQYFLWRGLAQLLGDENVVTFPFKKSYYGEVDKDYILPDGKTGYTAPYDFQYSYQTTAEFNGGPDIMRDFVKKRPTPRIYTLDDVVNEIKTFDLIIVSSFRRFALQAYNDLKARLPYFRCPVVYTDMEDASGINMWQVDEIHPDVIFKREMLMGEPYPSHYPVFPLPFSSHIEETDFVEREKKYDVFLACGITHPVRTQVLNKLKSMKINFIGGGNEFRRSWKDYNDLMEQSKISIIVRGWGWDTVRAWEAPAHRTMTMWYEHPQIIPNPFTHKEHTSYFNLNNLEEQIYYYLDNEKERNMIAEAGRKHLFIFHSNRARAQYLIDRVKEAVNG